MEQLNLIVKEMSRNKKRSGVNRYEDILERLENEEMQSYKDGECFMCHSTKNLTIHHIKSRLKYPELATNPQNIITLCQKCHTKTHKTE